MTAMRARWRTVLLVLGVALSLLAAWHYTALYRDATAARASLFELEETMEVATELGLDATSEDLAVMRADLAEAHSHVESAQTRLRWDPLLRVGRWVPAVGDQVVAAGAFLEIADALVESGDEALAVVDAALQAREAHEGDTRITNTAFDLLDQSGPRLARIQVLMDHAVAKRIEIGDRALLGPLDAARTKLDAQLPRAVELVDQAVVAHGVLPSLLGFEGERRYLLLSLNNAELMPGGGLVTGAGVLAVEDGRVVESTFNNSSSWVTDYQAAGGEHVEAPAPLRRHLLKEHSWNLGVSNWDPDFGTWAQQSLEMYEAAWGDQDVDGIVAVDLQVLEALLAITGEQTVEAPGFGEVQVSSDNAFIELERVTRAPPDTWRRSKAAVGALQQALLRDVLDLPADRWGSLVETMRELGEERHLQVLLFEPAAQQLVSEAGWDGRLLPPDGDYFQLNEASVNSTKLNAVFAPHGTYEIEVTALGTARHHLVLEYENTVREWAKDYDEDLVSHLMYDGQYGGYLRTFVPRDATGFSATIDGRPAAVEDEEALERHRSYGIYVPVPPDVTRAVGLSWSVPLATTDRGSYRLLLQKQPGTDGICLDLAVHRDGREPAAVTIEGGTRDDSGRVCLTTDVTLEVEFDG